MLSVPAEDVELPKGCNVKMNSNISDQRKISLKGSLTIKHEVQGPYCSPISNSNQSCLKKVKYAKSSVIDNIST